MESTVESTAESTAETAVETAVESAVVSTEQGAVAGVSAGALSSGALSAERDATTDEATRTGARWISDRGLLPRLLAFGGIWLVAQTLQAADADVDGCWEGYHPDGGSCVEFTAEQRDTRAFLKFSNRCDNRLFLTWCAGDMCGSDDLRAGQSKSKYVYTDITNTKIYAVGSKRASMDHICQEKLGRW